MTAEQLKAHFRLSSSLESRTVAAEEWHDEPMNWKPYNRTPTPAEFHMAREYLRRVGDAS